MKRHLYVLGAPSRVIPEADRQAWRLDASRLRAVLDGIVEAAAVEAVMLSTTARSELIVASDVPVHAGTLRGLFARLARGRLAATTLSALDIERDEQAVHRIFLLVAGLDTGLDSDEPGVDHDALAAWHEAFDGAVAIGDDSLLRRLGRLALAAGREARQVAGSDAGSSKRLDDWIRRLASDAIGQWRSGLRLAGRRLVLAAHGGGDGSTANRAVETLAAGLSDGLGGVAVDTAFHLGEPTFSDYAGSRDAIVLPLLTSRGWYYRKLAAALGDGPRLLPPLGSDPRLVARLVDELQRRLTRATVAADELAVLVVGHGTKRQATSGDATRAAAAAIADALPAAQVESAFLDQDPGLGETARRLSRSRTVLAVVPFLLGHGSHAGDDIDAALTGEAAPTRRIDLPPLFELPELPDVLAEIIADASDLHRSATPSISTRRAA